MPKEENKKNEAPTRKSWRDIVAARNPELDLENELDVGDWLDESLSRYDEGEAQRDQLNKILAADSRAAGILTGLSSGLTESGEPFSLIEYLITNYGDDIREAESTEDAVKRAKEREAESIKAAAEEEERKKNAEANLKKTDDALTAAVNSANVDEANVAAMLEWLYGTAEKDGLVHKIIRHELDAEDWTNLLHAFNMDSELESAREEGRREGKKKRPGSMHRNMAGSVPTDLGGGSGGTGQEPPTDPTLGRYEKMKRRF